MRDVILTNPHLRTYDKTNGIYITYNQSLKQINYDLHELKRELQELLETITNNPVFNSAWVDKSPTDKIQ